MSTRSPPQTPSRRGTHTRARAPAETTLLAVFTAAILRAIIPIALVGVIGGRWTVVRALGTILVLATGIAVMLWRMMGDGH